jgi:DNA-binding response OmpR family regulator
MSAGPRTAGRQVLIADDEPNIVAALEYLLQRHGYKVRIARNGDEALQLIERHVPDLVLLDVMMPLRSGYDVCRRMREHAAWRHIKVVMLSAKGREAEVERGISLGADLYITKPFSNRELVAKIGELLAAPDAATQHGDPG